MSLAPGSRFGPYEVLAKLGQGGMGEVYRARDTKLDRDVALKILPEFFATDPDRMKRFEREAKTLASLNHPQIAQIYGFEQSPSTRSTGSGQADISALVMELVEGEDLSQRIARGPIAIDEALPIARQLADAIEAAHAQGIIHRDLKPANIKVRTDGAVKVLDFGLAKALQEPSVKTDSGPADAVLNSPTITSPAATMHGVVLGTAAYMAPEQARGKVVDVRADIWAFGAVLFEMLTARRAFEGAEITDVLASIIKSDPQWAALPMETPRALRALIKRCLEKDPRRRLQSIGDARIQLEDLAAGAADEAATPTPAPRTRSRASVLPWAVAAASLIVAIAAVARGAPWRTAPAVAPVRLTVDLGEGIALASNSGSAGILSPDGQLLAIAARTTGGGPRQLYLRRLSDLQMTPLPGTDGALSPFFSPDGQTIAFFTGPTLKKVGISGGAVTTITDAPNSRGGAWTEDGTIVFAENRSALFKVAGSGGTRVPLTKLTDGEITHRYPQILPGNKAVLYTAHDAPDNFDNANLIVERLDTGERTVVLRGGYYGRYLATGHIIYVRSGKLLALPFDLERLTATGQAVPVNDRVGSTSGRGEAQFAVSSNGTLVYFAGGENDFTLPINWIDRTGKATVLRSVRARFGSLRFSPDGQRLAMDLYDGTQTDIWVYDWQRDALTKLTFDDANQAEPVWTPDGRRILYSSTRGGASELYWQRADGAGEPQQLTSSKSTKIPGSVHPSGKFLVYEESIGPDANVLIMPIEGSETAGWKAGTPTPFVATPFVEYDPRFSPDGRWIAYGSLESKRREVYVRPFPGPGGKWQISTEGGDFPVWSAARPELLFRSLDGRIMTVSYNAKSDVFQATKPEQWMPARTANGAPFDLHRDGQRIAAPPLQTETRESLVLVFNFFDELRRVAPAKN